MSKNIYIPGEECTSLMWFFGFHSKDLRVQLYKKADADDIGCGKSLFELSE